MRKIFAEFVGTFFIVLAPVAVAGSSKIGGHESSLLEAAFASGLPVIAMIAALGSISGAHFNPAVTFAFAMLGRFPWKSVPAYWAAQAVGGILAAGLVALLFGAGHGAHIPIYGLESWKLIGIETFVTFLLVFVILTVATNEQINAAIPPIAIGLTVVVGVLIGGPITGGSMNPARSIGPNLFAGSQGVGSIWIYIVGPMLGAVFALAAYRGLTLGTARLEDRIGKSSPANASE